MRIAIVGSGISGLTAAYLLGGRHDVTLFEAGKRLGGHTNTIEVEHGGLRHALDTGFIVYNERTYPNFSRLLAELDVQTQASDMSFSVRSDRTGWEYCGSSLSGLFAQRRNVARPAFYGMLRDILRFNRCAPRVLADEDDTLTLGDYVKLERFGRAFVDHYLIPMGAAIWSAPPERMREFPVRYFVQFCQNHGLLSLANRPQWRTVCGGAARYIEAMCRRRQMDVRLASPVRRLLRRNDGVTLVSGTDRAESFDHVIVAAHADQAIKLLADPSHEEREVLGAFEYQRNEALLHTDTSTLPRRKRAWASWNYHVPATARFPVSVTYWLNRLQRIAAPEQFCLTLNDSGTVHQDRVLKRITYHHPLYTSHAVAAQGRWAEISGQRRTHYCGAYWGYGFHEDGVNSAMAVARFFHEGLETCTVASTRARSRTAAFTP
ncbi:MAG: FAD-dependent oxidoreductase [Planctomycetota bacterium]|nr:MAG: FAD-dependent oxidoreductase [Planctomycetota bacterium]